MPGFFLSKTSWNHYRLPIVSSETAGDLEPSPALPLYHTTTLGRSAACDIRIRRRDLAKRHAMIYRYDGDWFIRPVSRRHEVYLNGVKIEPATPLYDGDQIQLGGLEFTFIDERVGGPSAGLIHPEQDDAAYSEPRFAKSSVLTWLLVNLFSVLGLWLVRQLVPSGFEPIANVFLMFSIVFVLIMNLYYFLLPLLLRGLDRSLLLIVFQLAALGIIFQARLSGILGGRVIGAANALEATGGTGQASTELLTEITELTERILSGVRPQGIALAIGLILLPFIAIITARTRLLEPMAFLCAFLTPLLLVTTLIFGHGSDQHGATLWISLGGLSIQLTEFAKITYLIVLAGFFKNRPSKKNQLLFAAWAGLVFLLAMLLPDLGMAMILLPTTMLVYVVMTSEYFTSFVIMLFGTALSVFAFAAFPHVQRRLSGWTTLWQEVNDSNRQIVYGLQAVARGGLFGRGIGNGSPGGIPLASSDMVYAILCEDLGLITGLAVVAVFIVLWLRAARVTVIAQDGFTSSLALAIGTMFFVEAVVVIAGVTGLIPLTGVTLPLIAEGGSSVLSKLMLLAVLIGLSARRDKGVAR